MTGLKLGRTRPLSPLLFVLAADLLRSILNKAKDQGLLNLPIQGRGGQNFPIVHYADDTLLIMEACPNVTPRNN